MTHEPYSGLLVLVCAATGGEISTGVEYTQTELTNASRITIHEECPFCKRGHVFRFAEARVIPTLCEALDATIGPHRMSPKAKRFRTRERQVNR